MAVGRTAMAARKNEHAATAAGAAAVAAVIEAPPVPKAAAAPATHAASPADALGAPITAVKGVGERLAEVLARLGLRTVGDLLRHYPRRYEDRARFARIADVADGETVTLAGKVTAVENRPTKTRLVLTKVTLDDGSGVATLTWFNQWRMKQVWEKLLGKRVVAYGAVKRGFASVEIAQPEWEALDEGADSLAVGRIVPIYPATEGVSQGRLRKIVHAAVDGFAARAPEPLPTDLIAARRLPGAGDALRAVHFPPDFAALERARTRLVFEELLTMQLVLAARKRAAREGQGIVFADTAGPVAELQGALPFPLTGAQRRVIDEITADMASPHPMHRLLQGDVGSGKTAVAMAAMLVAVRNGHQAALMAPTEILAEQHLRSVRGLLEDLGVRVDLLTGSRPAREKDAVRARVRSGETGVVVGTHALIQEGVEFARLGLAIVDEQHRFGVLQRAALTEKGAAGRAPDVLVMTATPIPRTLTLTVYGDLDVSVLDELPPGRKPVRTHWKRSKDKTSVYEGVRKLLAEGRQAYVVCPLVEESEKLQARAATELASHLAQHVFPEFGVGLLHGQLSGEEKDEVMRRFRQGDVHLLVATTVIEVGVDVSNAAVMVIEDADRFGLAQLHQLRGRVGRGAHASFCVLIADPKTPEGEERMRVVAAEADGFRIAEADLRLRGPGEFYGVRQSGLPALRIADVVRDVEVLKEARAAAFDLLRRDPRLSRPEHRALREAAAAQGRGAAADLVAAA
jgi:ATP-dependent DNA helicase RecG